MGKFDWHRMSMDRNEREFMLSIRTRTTLENKNEPTSLLFIINNYRTRLSKISWFVSGEQINYLLMPKAEANNWSATDTTRHWQITIFKNRVQYCFIIQTANLFLQIFFKLKTYSFKSTSFNMTRSCSARYRFTEKASAISSFRNGTLLFCTTKYKCNLGTVFATINSVWKLKTSNCSRTRIPATSLSKSVNSLPKVHLLIYSFLMKKLSFILHKINH